MGQSPDSLELLQALAATALAERNWTLLHSLEPLIDAEQKRQAAPRVASLEDARKRREAGRS